MDKFQKTLVAAALGTVVGLTATSSTAGNSHVEFDVYANVAMSLSFIPMNGVTPSSVDAGAGAGVQAVQGEFPSGEGGTNLNSEGDTLVNGGLTKVDGEFMYLVERQKDIDFMFYGKQEFYLKCKAYDLYKGGQVVLTTYDPTDQITPIDIPNPNYISATKVAVSTSFASIDPWKDVEFGNEGSSGVDNHGFWISTGYVPFSGGTVGKLANMGTATCTVTYKLEQAKAEAGSYWGKVKLYAIQDVMDIDNGA